MDNYLLKTVNALLRLTNTLITYFLLLSDATMVKVVISERTLTLAPSNLLLARESYPLQPCQPPATTNRSRQTRRNGSAGKTRGCWSAICLSKLLGKEIPMVDFAS